VRLLLLANTLPPRDVSGVGEQVLQLAAGLRQEGVEVEVLGRGPGGVAGPKALFPLFAVPAVWRALRRFRPDVVQVHESDGGLAAMLVAWLAPSLDPRPLLVALLQVSYREERRAVRALRWEGRLLALPSPTETRFRHFKAPLQIALGWLTARTADRVLAPSAVTAAELRRDYGVREVAVVPNAMGAGAAARLAAAGEEHEAGGGEEAAEEGGEQGKADEKAPRQGEPGFLLVVGRLRIRKGVDVLLAALPELRRRHPGARLLIAGDGEHRPVLERAVADRGLSGAVTFLGRASAGEVRRLLRGAVALVVPSIYEGMPLVVLEAMEEGVPVVASRVSGIPEVVENGCTGWTVPPEDPASLAAALTEVLDDPAAARRRGARGRRRLEASFRPAAAARAWRRAVLGPLDLQISDDERVGRLRPAGSAGKGELAGRPAGGGPAAAAGGASDKESSS
jgi:glycosyltransferase involved in cell wall biosynthesis